MDRHRHDELPRDPARLGEGLRRDDGDRLPGPAHAPVVAEDVEADDAVGEADRADRAGRHVGAPDRSVHHAGQDDVGRVDRGAGDLGGGVDALHVADPAVVLTAARGGDGTVDAFVGTAPAQVAGERLGDDLAARAVRLVGTVLGPPPVVEGDRLDDEPRRAVAALEPVVVGEGPLDGVEVLAVGEALDGRDARAAQPGGGGEAAEQRFAVDEHRARTAHPAAADELRAGQAESVAHDVQRRLRAVDVEHPRLVVDRGGELHEGLLRLRLDETVRHDATSGAAPAR